MTPTDEFLGRRREKKSYNKSYNKRVITRVITKVMTRKVITIKPQQK